MASPVSVHVVNEGETGVQARPGFLLELLIVARSILETTHYINTNLNVLYSEINPFKSE